MWTSLDTITQDTEGTKVRRRKVSFFFHVCVLFVCMCKRQKNANWNTHNQIKEIPNSRRLFICTQNDLFCVLFRWTHRNELQCRHRSSLWLFGQLSTSHTRTNCTVRKIIRNGSVVPFSLQNCIGWSFGGRTDSPFSLHVSFSDLLRRRIYVIISWWPIPEYRSRCSYGLSSLHHTRSTRWDYPNFPCGSVVRGIASKVQDTTILCRKHDTQLPWLEGGSEPHEETK